MRIAPLVLLLVTMLACCLPTQQALPAETGVPAKSPDAATVKKLMTPAQLALGDPIANSVGMLLVPIPAGEFQMGSPDSDDRAGDHEKPQHLVEITKPFYLSVCEVTQQQYEQIMEARPWQGKPFTRSQPDHPATSVTWHEAVEFCRKLSEREGVDYRLPTEAEWEYACRAGTTSIYSFGDDVSKLGEYAWYRQNAWDLGQRYAHPVAQKRPNPWGLYDMHGNALELCQDWYAPYGADQLVSDPAGPAQGKTRLLRGGCIDNFPRYVRSANRAGCLPDGRSGDVGFRVAKACP